MLAHFAASVHSTSNVSPFPHMISNPPCLHICLKNAQETWHTLVGETRCNCIIVRCASQLTHFCREIRKYQSTATMLVPRTPVVRLAKEIMQKLNPGTGKVQDEFPNRFAASAILALQESMEIYLVSLFEDANLCAIHAKRVTVMCALISHVPVLLCSLKTPFLVPWHVNLPVLSHSISGAANYQNASCCRVSCLL